ncbi:hypothetical protein [Methanopyrus sp.]
MQGTPKHVTGNEPPILPRDSYLDLLARTQLITGVPELGRVDFRMLESVHEYVRPLLTTIHLAHHWETRQVHEEIGRLVADVLREHLHREVADAHKRAVRALGSRYPTPAYTPDARVRWARQLAGLASDRVLTKVQDFARLVAHHRLVNRLWTLADTVTLLGYEKCVDLVEMAYSYTEHDLPGHEIERLLRPWIDVLRDPTIDVWSEEPHRHPSCGSSNPRGPRTCSCVTIVCCDPANGGSGRIVGRGSRKPLPRVPIELVCSRHRQGRRRS